MYATLREPLKVMRQKQYLSRIKEGLSKVFGESSDTYWELIDLLNAVAETHDRGKRRDGSLLKSHEFQMFALAFFYLKIRDVAILKAIILHDMNEDYPEVWSLELIAERHGAEVRNIVNALTKPNKALFASEQEYDQAVFAKVRSGGSKSMIAKTIDRFHNMVTLYGGREKQVKKVLQTIKYVLPIAADSETLVQELVAAVHFQMRELNIKPAPPL